MINCLLFDNDGTLVDSESLCNRGLVLQFAKIGIELDEVELTSRYRGWKLALILEDLASKHGVELSHDFIPQYRAKVSVLFESELKPVLGVQEALKQLPQPKAVVSSGPPEKIRQALRLCKLTPFFSDNIISSYEVGVWKPDPEIYRYAARMMGFKSSECAVIEDGMVGVRAGVEAGMKVFYFSDQSKVLDIPGVISFDSMKQLPGLIKQENER